MSARRDSTASVLSDLTEEDPVERAFRLAPLRCDEQVSDEEREAMAAAASGPWHEGATVTAEIEARRAR